MTKKTCKEEPVIDIPTGEDSDHVSHETARKKRRFEVVIGYWVRSQE